jgi:hypothetical protein
VIRSEILRLLTDIPFFSTLDKGILHPQFRGHFRLLLALNDSLDYGSCTNWRIPAHDSEIRKYFTI